MDADDRRFLLTAAWLFARHGQGTRAQTLCEALVEDDPRDGVAAVALAELRLADADAAGALDVLRAAEIPPALARAAALLESRELTSLGKPEEGARCWRRHLAAAKGGARTWI